MQPNRIILHHSLTKDSETVSWGAIRNYHINNNGWFGIGYHFGIEDLRGQIEILMGRFPDQQGAHCRGNNADSIGICFVGNFDIEPPSEIVWKKGIMLCKYLMEVLHIQTVQGHRELDPRKTCPGRLFDLDKFRKELGV